MKIIILIAIIPLINLFAQDTISINMKQDSIIAGQKWIQLMDSCEHHFNNRIITKDSTMHQEYLKFNNTIIQIRSIRFSGKYKYELMIIKLHKDTYKYKNLSKRINELVFSLMVSKKWRDKMKFDPSKKYKGLDIMEISCIEEKSFRDVTKYINKLY